jgi:hypothetical protein
MCVDGLKVGFEDVDLLEGTAGGMRVNGLTVGSEEVGQLEGAAVKMRVDVTEDMGVVVDSVQKSGESKWETPWALMSMALSKEMM